MSEYQQSLKVDAPPDAVIAFVADIRNLPKYLPTTKDAQSQGEDRVRVQGEANEHPYDADGYLRRDPNGRRLDWGADEGYYAGSLEVEPDGAGSNVTVRIVLKGTPPGADPDQAPDDAQINEGLIKSLQSIQNQVEGKGGKVEPSAAT